MPEEYKLLQKPGQEELRQFIKGHHGASNNNFASLMTADYGLDPDVCGKQSFEQLFHPGATLENRTSREFNQATQMGSLAAMDRLRASNPQVCLRKLPRGSVSVQRNIVKLCLEQDRLGGDFYILVISSGKFWRRQDKC